MTSVAYVDASALVKLIVLEADSAAFLRWYIEAERVATSRVGVIETRRAAGRHPHDAGKLRAVLATVEVVELDRQVDDRAAAAVPPLLRTLDAIHIATALELVLSLDAFVTYDDRLAAAAHAAGLPVHDPLPDGQARVRRSASRGRSGARVYVTALSSAQRGGRHRRRQSRLPSSGCRRRPTRGRRGRAGRHRTGQGRPRPPLPDPRRGSRQPQPVGRQRRAARSSGSRSTPRRRPSTSSRSGTRSASRHRSCGSVPWATATAAR